MGAKKDAKKDKKGKKGKKIDTIALMQQEALIEPEPEQEEEKEEVQLTDTSYTSASFEELPPMPIIVEERKRPKKKKKAVEEEKVEVIEFIWSEDSLPPLEEEEERKIEEDEGEKKPKKESKKKKKDKEKEQIPDFEKPKEWKKMNKKDRALWLENRMLQWKEEMEAEKQAKIAGAKENRLLQEKLRNERMERDIKEQEARRDLLEKTCTLFHNFETQFITYQNKKIEQAAWQQYLRCDGLPDPRIVTQMATYLHCWQEYGTYDDHELESKFREALPMLEMLEEICANTKQFSARQIQNYDEIRVQLREQLSKAIQLATYYLLRNLEKNLEWHSIKLATYNRKFEALNLNLWVAVRMPSRLPKPVEAEPEPVELTFPELKTTIRLPKTIDGSDICMRAARSTVDLLSERSKSFRVNQQITSDCSDLFIFNVKELENIINEKKKQDAVRKEFFKRVNTKIKELETYLKNNVYAKADDEKAELENLYMAEPAFMLEPREYFADQNERQFRRFLKRCNYRARTGEINLRKYRICGGILNLDLIVIPPQPKPMNYEIQITTLELPKDVKTLDYKVQYRDPPPPPPGVTRTPEEIEEEMKKIEASYEKLAMIVIELPEEVLWVEPPIICQWQDSRSLWTSNYINDYKFNEDKLSVQFRTGVLWPIGIATMKYSNLPYQGWELKPSPTGRGVMIIVTGVFVTVTWLVTGNYVKLKFISNATTPALKEHFNKAYSVKRMVQIMREGAADFFPEFDAHNHVEGSCFKEWIIEQHIYHAMAFMSRAYNFQWSRWNATAGSRQIIMQLREAVDKKREGKLQLLYASPERAYILKHNEMDTEFSMDPMMGMEFYPDLFTLNLSYGSVDARRTTFNMKSGLVETVFNFLQELKICSFS